MGKPKAQMLNSVESESVNAAYRWFQGELNPKKKQYQLHSANAVFVEKTLTVLDSFWEAIRACFSSSVEEKNFAQFPDRSRREVNRWVYNKTSEKIEDLLPPDAVDGTTRMILVNALYFKADWLNPFTTQASTYDGNFYPEEGNFARSQQVTMMTQKQKRAYFHRSDDALVLGLPYKQEELTMFFIMPKGITHKLDEHKYDSPLSDLEASLSGSSLRSLMDSAVESGLQNVRVTIPKFKMSHTLPLKKVMIAAGIGKIFDAEHADFSGITGRRDLYVSGAFHKGLIEVNENGTEAAAATGFVLAERSGPRGPSFTANRPFMFLIRHNSSETILFAGRFSDVDGLDQQEE